MSGNTGSEGTGSTGTGENTGTGTTGTGSTGSTGGDGGGERTFTQADLDRIVGERVLSERKKYGDYDELKTKAAAADDTRTEMQKLTDEVKSMREDREKRDFADLQRTVAEEAGLPAKYARRLHGKTREELAADAADFAESLGEQQQDQQEQQARRTPAVQRGRPRENLRGGGTPDDEVIETDPKKLAAMVNRH